MDTNDTATEKSKKAAEIDLTKYQTPELAERLTELISVPQALAKILKVAALIVVLSLVICYFVSSRYQLDLSRQLGVGIYFLIVGAISGLILGLLRVISQALEHIESILIMVLEMSAQVASDYEQLQLGEAELPAGDELIEIVYDKILMPTLERAVASAFGFLASPMIWLYHRSIGVAVRRLVKRANRASSAREQTQGIVDTLGSGVATIAQYTLGIKAYLLTASEIARKMGKSLRFYVMLPMYVLFFISLSAAVLPLVIMRYAMMS
ncbi:hypothetical protein [Persicirhabdus sediminis]|uniref:Uncharacterized protein n=1 Tax=Persicirhabdus sediminis TaxID=454144 RepID=A0A8J7ME26_9BACT|nr:hypothetical protein [Persicirhabdus sediminis]MBK1790828.1 hypothetical protein [Persicirhabdus sediminis]